MRVRVTGNVATLGGGTLKNGAIHTVAGFTDSGGIRLENGKVISADAGHLRYGYVDTSFASQGKTVKRVILGMAAQSLPATSMEQLYVSATRGKERVTVYTDDKDAVQAAIGRSSQKLAALDLKSDQQKEAEQQRQRLEADRHRSLWLGAFERWRADRLEAARKVRQAERARQRDRELGHGR